MQETICALSTPSGMGAIAMVRISGKEAWSIARKCFKNQGREIRARVSYFENFYDGDEILDQILITYFQNPQSFTGEDMVEISCHGSLYIQKRIVEILIGKVVAMQRRESLLCGLS